MATRLRVLTMNVQNDEGPPGRMKVLNQGLRELAPDLLALQEVMGGRGQGPLGELLDGTGLHGSHQAGVLGYDMPWADRYGGTALATRWPHQIVETLDFRLADAMDVPWCTMAASVAVPGEGELLFIAATLAWRLDAEAARVRQAVAITDLDAQHRRQLPTIIAGDFNAAPEAASIRYLTGLQPVEGRSMYYHDAWAVAGDGPGDTWTGGNPAARAEISQLTGQPGHRRRLDYVFTGSPGAHPGAHCRIRAASRAFDQSSDGIWASGHSPLPTQAWCPHGCLATVAGMSPAELWRRRADSSDRRSALARGGASAVRRAG
jgi:endonuclease/exonuclease/phosphatase family metal-dependent hydrolase